MTTNFMLQLAKALEQCPKCHKVTLDSNSTLDISSSKIVRTCQCGYSIEISIKESLNNNQEPEPERKILLENDKSNIVSEPPKIIDVNSNENKTVLTEKPEKLNNVIISESNGKVQDVK